MRKVLSGVMVVALGLAACGGDDDGGTVSSDSDTPTTAAGGSGDESNTVRVTASDLTFDPTTADATAGDVNFELTNKDTTKHTFTIDGVRVDIELDPGTTSGAQATLDAGTYEWHCTIHSSMKGTLTVS